MGTDALLPSLRRGLGWRLPAAVLLTAAAICLDNSQEIGWALARGTYDTRSFTDANGIFHPGQNTCVLKYLFLSVTYGGVFGVKFAAMLAALPAAGQYARERAMAPYLLARCGSARYALAKLLSASLLGGGTLAAGTALFMGVLGAFGMPLTAGGFTYELGEHIPYYGALVRGLPYAAWAVFFAFLRGFLWGGAAACVSAYLPNLFAVTVSPFLFAFLMNRLEERSPLPPALGLGSVLQMRAWLGDPLLTAGAAAGAVLIIWGLCLWLFRRRIREGRS